MRIKIERGTLTKEEVYKLGELLIRAGYRVSVRKGTSKEKSVTCIDLDDPRPMEPEEDLS